MSTSWYSSTIFNIQLQTQVQFYKENIFNNYHPGMENFKSPIIKGKKGKAIPVKAMKAHRVVRRRGSHIF
jgi:hypothetical protein